MVVTTIYVSRHGFRGTWSLNPTSGVYTANIKSPTGIAGDPPLVAYGVQQSHQLADALTSISPPIAQIYSSPYYRCLETIRPTAEKLDLEIRADSGLGEWFGCAPFSHPQPAQHSVLARLFPSLSNAYIPSSCFPSPLGESIEELHTRIEIALSHIITHADAESRDNPIAILICTHAAALIAIGRVLTGSIPSEVGEEDFYAYTAGITKFERKIQSNAHHEDEITSALTAKDQVQSNCITGNGVMGGWNCVLNCDCTHLSGGGERGWHFSGDEAFSNTMEGAKL